MIPASLLDAIADRGMAFSRLASDLGVTVAIDPHELLRRDMALSSPGLWSPNRHCRLVEASDGWLAVNLAREDDRDVVPAWLQCEVGGQPWAAIVEIARDRLVVDLLERAIMLGMPVSVVGETASPDAWTIANGVPQPRRLSEMSVIDLSALWAGPLCGGLLSEAGMAVTKVEASARPDPTRLTMPLHDKRLNGRKRRMIMNLKEPELLQTLATADILITSARPHALERFGLTPDALFARNPGLIWVAITAHGFDGPDGMRVGFGDDAAAAGGLLAWEDGQPRFLGDALADPLTGLRAAHSVLERVGSGQSGLIDVALAPTAADFAQQAGLL